MKGNTTNIVGYREITLDLKRGWEMDSFIIIYVGMCVNMIEYGDLKYEDMRYG